MNESLKIIREGQKLDRDLVFLAKVNKRDYKGELSQVYVDIQPDRVTLQTRSERRTHQVIWNIEYPVECLTRSGYYVLTESKQWWMLTFLKDAEIDLMSWADREMLELKLGFGVGDEASKRFGDFIEAEEFADWLHIVYEIASRAHVIPQVNLHDLFDLVDHHWVVNLSLGNTYLVFKYLSYNGGSEPIFGRIAQLKANVLQGGKSW